MRKLAISAALASTILAAPAVARDGAGYVGLNIGPMLVEDNEFDLLNGADSFKDAVLVDHKLGWDADLIGGYDFGRFRLEGELAHKRARVDDVQFSGATGFPQDYYDNHGSARVTSLMGNALLDFGDDDAWGGFVGGGVGGARVKYDVRGGAGSGSGLAWQLLAGVRAAINNNVDFGIKYRFFNARKLEFGFDGDRVRGGRFRSHSLLAGITYNFVAPPVVVVPPVVEAAPPPPATQTCPDGSVILATDACPVPPPPPAPSGERG